MADDPNPRLAYQGSLGAPPNTMTGGSPYAIGNTMPGDHSPPEYVRDVQTVWNREHANIGWVVFTESGHRYFAENRNAEYSISTSVSGSYGVGQGSANYTTQTGPGPALELGPGPLLAQINEMLKPGNGPATQIISEFDSRRPSSSVGGEREGSTLLGSPEAIGSEIPTKDGKTTSVVDINAVTDRGGKPTGWVYLGADGHKYLQANNANRDHITPGGGLGAGGFGVQTSNNLPSVGPVSEYEFGAHQVDGSIMVPLHRGATPILDDGFGPRVSVVDNPRGTTSGTIIGSTDDTVYQNGGRVVYAHDVSRFPDGTPPTGSSVTITPSQTGPTSVSFDPPSNAQSHGGRSA